MTTDSTPDPHGMERLPSHWVFGVIDSVPFLASLAAGIYLLQAQSVAGESTWFDVIGHGIGIYFIAKSFYMGRTITLQRQIRDAVSDQAYGE